MISWQRAKLLGAIGDLAAACSSNPANVTRQAGALDACQTVLTTTSGGSIIEIAARARGAGDPPGLAATHRGRSTCG